MAIKFYYIDNEEGPAQNYIRGFSQTPDFKVELLKASSMEGFMEAIRQTSDLEGIIIDHKLNDLPLDNHYLKFRGTTLAQEIRNRQMSKEPEYSLKDFPVVLLSATINIKEALDDTGKDLFDLVISKDALEVEDYSVWIHRLMDLCQGYKELRRTKSVGELLRIDSTQTDSRFVAYFQELLDKKPVHQVAMFLLRHFIEREGLLVTESVLAARLGVDREHSGDWKKVLAYFAEAQYKGIFSGYQKMWWMKGIEKKWNEMNPSNLRSLSASQKVEILKNTLSFKGVAAIQKADYADSDRFWTVCRGTEKPIDELDGLIVAGQDTLYPWEDYEYVSVYAALFSENREEWVDIDEMEKKRLKEIKEMLRCREL